MSELLLILGRFVGAYWFALQLLLAGDYNRRCSCK